MKKGRLYFSIFITSLFFSCKQEVPNGIIEVDPMADLLFDISLAEGYVESFILRDTALVKDSVYRSEINKVLQLHNTSPDNFSKSYSYYTHNPVLFKRVMDSANARALRNKEEAIKVESKHLQKIE